MIAQKNFAKPIITYILILRYPMMAKHGIHLDHGYIMDMEVMKPITPVMGAIITAKIITILHTQATLVI